MQSQRYGLRRAVREPHLAANGSLELVRARLNSVEALQQSDDDVRSLGQRELLAYADTWTRELSVVSS